MSYPRGMNPSSKVPKLLWFSEPSFLVALSQELWSVIRWDEAFRATPYPAYVHSRGISPNLELFLSTVTVCNSREDGEKLLLGQCDGFLAFPIS